MDKVRVIECPKCEGTGQRGGVLCDNCQGMGYIGKDNSFEYLLSKNKEGQFLVREVKDNKFNSQNSSVSEYKQNDQIQSKLKSRKSGDNSIVSFINILLVLSGIISAVIYFFLLPNNRNALIVMVLSIGFLVLYNIFQGLVFDYIANKIKVLWASPNDYVSAVTSRRKEIEENL